MLCCVAADLTQGSFHVQTVKRYCVISMRNIILLSKEIQKNSMKASDQAMCDPFAGDEGEMHRRVETSRATPRCKTKAEVTTAAGIATASGTGASGRD